jgi:KipI family sensor histidine kinase inhibitor
VEIAVRYDGDDLHAVAAETGLAPHHVVEVHASVTYTVAFCGFAPGFAYLTGLDQRLHLPRLSTPRTRVPAGSVAIAAEYAGVYPRSSPGGWRLLGRTDADLFDPDRREPALLTPGTRVRFVPQGRRP